MPTPEHDHEQAVQQALVALHHDWGQATIEAMKVGSSDSITHQTRTAVIALLRELGGHLGTFQRLVRRSLQDLLNASVGQSFGSLEANQAITREVLDLLNRLGLRFVCPREGCGRPAALRCTAAGISRHGVFQFDHAAGGRRTTHKGSSVFPRLTLVPAPADRRRSERTS
jgi:hypothetical protein